ncbi:inactive TPR repeat-containing thioredoxin TTL3 [Ricinus communis]|uniref:inactive TPR repeat-containing thioredoxin TTL3 n=1 Tax=Ricinus communis TaxID=3988 RepID=UPI00201B3030|nr:inactive TPR repeat-containing thioredoxin TTL3 [Ricinus communis]
MGDISPDKKSGCGLLNAVFGRRSFWPRRTTSASSLPTVSGNTFIRTPSTPKRRRSGSDEAAFLEISTGTSDAPPKPITKAPDHPKIPPILQQQHHQQNAHAQQQQQQNCGRKPVDEAKKILPDHGNQNYAYVHQGRKLPKEAVGISGELEIMIADHQKNNGSNTLVRASSSNVMLFGNLGNLRQPGAGGGGNMSSYNVLDHLPKTAREENPVPNGKYPNSVMGNVIKKQHEEKPGVEQQPAGGSLCRALSTRMDPEQLKIMGNEDYKNGNFAEALALYDAAISIDPNKASYRSNKSAALTALGRLLEAVFECREAIRIDPHYHRAHHRLANLCVRLGDGEKAMYHYKHSGPEADHVDIAKAKGLQVHLNKCTEARRLRDWNTLIKETKAAISSGADSAPQIYALQAEALMKIRRHQEADEVLKKGPNFDVDDCTKYFGPIANANLLMVRAQVDMAVGRFDDALAKAQRATRLDSNNKEAGTVMRKARAVAAARSNGNQLFKAAKFYEASNVYGEGLEHDPYNSVLLCNRAACRCKLGQYEKAVEDCNAALSLRPGYCKARLRRADCYTKLGKLEASIQDFEILQKEAPDDEEVSKGLLEAKAQAKRTNRGGGGYQELKCNAA